MSGSVAIIFASEDSKSMIAARLQAASANMDLVEIVTSVGDPPRDFYLPDDVLALAQMVRDKGARVVYFDSLFNHFAPGLAPKNPQDARIVMSALAELTHETGVTALAVRHWGKELRSAASRGLGATELTNVARSVLAVAKHADRSDTYVLAPSKRNYGRPVASLTYQIVSQQVFDPNGLPMFDDDGMAFTVGRIEWGDTEWISADDLSMPKNDSPDEKAAIEAADDFLRDILADGPQPAESILKAATKAKFSRATIYRAKKKLRVESERHGYPAVATWSLPSRLSDVSHTASTRDAETTETTVLSLVEGEGKSKLSQYSSPPTRARDGENTDDFLDASPSITPFAEILARRDRAVAAGVSQPEAAAEADDEVVL